MFNGIILNTGIITNIYKDKKNCEIEVLSKMEMNKKEIGSSISCSGVCLTVEKVQKNKIHFYVSRETLNKTNFNYLKKGDLINLEKSLKFSQRISGHFVQGHIDTTAIVRKIEIFGKSWVVRFNLSKKFNKYFVEKGSIAINGVSLTISKIFINGFQITIIPQTIKFTNLIKLKENDRINVEFDILGKYIQKYIK